MANNNPGYCLYKDSQGFDTSRLPNPYCGWAKTSSDKSVMSIHNAAKTKATLHRYTMQALLDYADAQNAEIGVVKIADGSYASEWTKSDGSSIIAHATANGILAAGKRDPLTGKMSPLPNIGSSSQEFNDASILILYLLIEADINAAAGNNTNTITHDLLRAVRDEYAKNGEIDEPTARLVCDDLYFSLSYAKIPVNIRGGSISLLTDRRLASNEFATGQIICGTPSILVGGTASGKAAAGVVFVKNTIESAKKLAEAYTSTLSWTKEEEMMIPQFPDDKEVPPEVMLMLNRFLASREWESPLNNPCWRGTTAFGKSTGAKMLACILHTPLVWMTCATTTELESFLSKHVPNTDPDPVNVSVENLPSFDDIANDPAYAYQVLTGVEKEDATCDEAFEAYRKVVEKSAAEETKIPVVANKNQFKIVESDFVKALVHGYICEVQEFSRIRDSGTLVGLNNYNEPDSVIPLVDGRHVRRHKNAMVIWTDNVGLASCRKVDASVLRRFSYIIDSYELPRDRAIRRIKENTKCQDEGLINKMYDIWMKIAQFCKERDIQDEGTCSLAELETWVMLTSLEGTESILETCKQTVVAKLSSDAETQKEIIDGCVMLALSSAGFIT